MELPTQQLPISASHFKELLTSRKSIRRFNDPSKDTLGLYDPDARVVYVITRSELSKSMHTATVTGTSR